MAHSFLSVTNSSTERTIGVLDSVIHLFMIFFAMSVEENDLNECQKRILEHYHYEMKEVHWSDISLKEDEIYQDDKLKSWFLGILDEINRLVTSQGEFIDKNYVNGLSDFKYTANQDIPIQTLTVLIEDLKWLLNESDYSPSGQLKWFEIPNEVLPS